ncbi:MAG: branched-chain amino acid ABC transporter permease [Chloroflexi bacterium]|nr:branched-chain amino acid ABC transporter permease [Chloroflexota bacterium]
MAEQGTQTPRATAPATAVAGAVAVETDAPRARGLFGLDEHIRNRALFGIFVAFIVLYPLIDRGLGIGRMGSMNPILIFTLLALGLNIVVGLAGLLDLGYVAFFAIGGYTVAFLTAPQSPLVQAGYATSFWVALPLSFIVSAVFGLILGAPTLRLRGDYLAIVTLAFGEIVPNAFRNLEGLTNGNKGMNPIGRPTFGSLELLASDQVPWYYLILAVSVVSIFVIVRLRDSRLGRAWVAMREDEIAASAMGIDLVRTKLLAFALGASFSGFGGALYASMLQFIGPDQFDFSISIILLAMVIMGGIGNVWGVMFGGIVLGIFNFILVDSVRPAMQTLSRALSMPILAQIDIANAKLMIFGLALVLMMLLRPEGIFPSAQRKQEMRRGRARPGLGTNGNGA